MSKYPYGGDRKADASSRANKVLGYKKGGAVEDNGTNINITIGKPEDEAGAGMPPMMPPPPPPMMKPPGPPMGGPPPMPGMGGPPPMMGMKRGGRTGGNSGSSK
jgi:hypothetical protein